MANRPFEFGLTSEYNKYTLERPNMGRCADKNGPAKALSQLEIASYRDSINNKLGLHHSSDVTFGGQGLESPILKLTKFKI